MLLPGARRELFQDVFHAAKISNQNVLMAYFSSKGILGALPFFNSLIFSNFIHALALISLFNKKCNKINTLLTNYSTNIQTQNL